MGAEGLECRQRTASVVAGAALVGPAAGGGPRGSPAGVVRSVDGLLVTRHRPLRRAPPAPLGRAAGAGRAGVRTRGSVRGGAAYARLQLRELLERVGPLESDPLAPVVDLVDGRFGVACLEKRQAALEEGHRLDVVGRV